MKCKACKACNRDLPVCEFFKDSAGIPKGKCKNCINREIPKEFRLCLICGAVSPFERNCIRCIRIKNGTLPENFYKPKIYFRRTKAMATKNKPKPNSIDFNKVRNEFQLPPFKPGLIECLGCSKLFKSFDQKKNRMCKWCRMKSE